MPTYEVDIQVQAEDEAGTYTHGRDLAERRFVRSVTADSPQEAMHVATVWVTRRLANEA